MSLIACREAITAALAAALKAAGGRAGMVKSHPGRFDLGELKSYAVKAPAVLVAAMTIGSLRATAEGVVGAVTWVAFVITKDLPQLPRDTGALALVTSLLPVVNGNCWGLETVDDPKQISADNLYSGAIDKQGIALWGIRWQQDLLFDSLDLATLDIFITLTTDWDLAPTDGALDATDTVTLDN